MAVRKKLLVGILVVVYALSVTGIVSGGQYWVDPPIPDTPYHVWAPDGAEIEIKTKIKHEGDVKFEVKIRFECSADSWEAGINSNDQAPGDWMMYGTAECGKKIEFKGVYHPDGDGDHDGHGDGDHGHHGGDHDH